MIKYRGFEIESDYAGYGFSHPDYYDVDHDGEHFVGNEWGGHASTVEQAKEMIDEIWLEQEDTLKE